MQNLDSGRPIQIQILRAGIKAPRPATSMSAGYDLQASLDNSIMIYPGGSALVPTGLKVYTGDRSLGCFIIPKSGKGSKGFGIKNMVGLIDPDYQGELMVRIFNTNPTSTMGMPVVDGILTIDPFDYIAQMYFAPIVHRPMMVVTQFTTVSERGEKGFGEATEEMIVREDAFKDYIQRKRPEEAKK